MTSRRPYWCPETMKRRPCWCPKLALWELNSFLLQTLSMVPINLHRYWPREWKHSIGPVNYIVINFRSDHTSHYGMYARLFNTYQHSNRSILNSPEIPSWSSNHRNCIQLFWVYILSQRWLVQHLLHSRSIAFQSPNVTKCPTQKKKRHIRRWKRLETGMEGKGRG